MSLYKMNEKVIVKPCLVEGQEFPCKDALTYRYITVKEDMVAMCGKMCRIDRIDSDGTYQLEGCPFWFTEDMLLPVRFEEGDIVKLNPDAKLGDFATKDTYHGYDIAVYSGTLDMLANDFKMSFEDEYVVGDLEFLKHTVITLKGFNGLFESALFTLVRRPEKIKEATIEELEKQLGCKIKIIKENNNG